MTNFDPYRNEPDTTQKKDPKINVLYWSFFNFFNIKILQSLIEATLDLWQFCNRGSFIKSLKKNIQKWLTTAL